MRKLNSGIHGSLFVYNKKSFKVPFMKYFISLVAVLEFTFCAVTFCAVEFRIE